MPVRAFERIGRDISLDALEREVMKMTFSFARPAAASRFLAAKCNAGGVCYPFFTATSAVGGVIAIETAGDAPTSKLLPLAKLSMKCCSI